MLKILEPYRRKIFVGIILVALGIVYNTTLSNTSGSLGIVFIGIGSLFFISGMKMKKEIENDK